MERLAGIIVAGLLAVTLAACGAGSEEQNLTEGTGAVANTQTHQTTLVREGTAGSSADETVVESGSGGVADESESLQDDISIQISVESNGQVTVFELNDSNAARTLVEQLPMTIEVEDYGRNEKIFYPPAKLDTSDTPMAQGGIGSLAYYAPWGDVVMFYADFSSAGGLYELGHAVSGAEWIESMSGTIQINVVNN